MQELRRKPEFAQWRPLPSAQLQQKPVESNNTTGPDQIADLLCDLCIHDDDHIEATAFCKDCKQYLCTTCHRVHQRGTATKQHEVVRGRNNLPQSNKQRSEAHPEPVKDSAKTNVDKKAVYLEQIAIGSSKDKYFSSVNAKETMIDGSMLVCDYGNYKLKLFDSDGDFLYEMGLSSEPYGLASLNSTEAIVTLPKESCLQNVKIKSNDMVQLGKKLKTKMKCEKILKYKEHFLVTAYDDVYFCISVIDWNGKLIQSLYNEPKQAVEIFESYYEIALSPDIKTVYITNKEDGCVGLSLTGEIIFKYKEPGEGGHFGVCTGPEGYIYVACFDSDKIIMLNKGGKKIKDLVSLKGMRPSYVEYNAAENKLYVGQTNTNKMLCYHITF